jgi:TAP-like protein
VPEHREARGRPLHPRPGQTRPGPAGPADAAQRTGRGPVSCRSWTTATDEGPDGDGQPVQAAPAGRALGELHRQLPAVAGDPLIGRLADVVPFCVGWPHPVHPNPAANTGSKALVIAHQFDGFSPNSWAALMAQRIGAASFAIDDDDNAGAMDGPCANRVVAFVESGTQPHGHCAGVPLPTP